MRDVKKVSLLGLGAMGSALAGALLRKGAVVTVWNRNEEKTKKLVEKGANAAPDIRTAIEVSPLVIICVSDYEATKGILMQINAETDLQKKTIVQLSTGTPQEARALAEWAEQKGAQYLDGDILAWPSQIGGEATTILVAGDKAVYAEHESCLRMLAGNLTYMGVDVGSSSALFAAVLSYLAGQWIGLCHGALICQAEGLRVDEYGRLLNNLSSILGAELEHMGEVIQHNRFQNPESTVKTTGMDLVKLLQHANEAKIDQGWPAFAANIFKKAMQQGYGTQEHAAIIKVMQENSKVLTPSKID